MSTEPGQPSDPSHIEDQSRSAISHDGCADVAAEALQLPAERLDDDLLGVADLVDHEPELTLLGLQNDDIDCVPSRAGVGSLSQDTAQVDERKKLSAVVKYRCAVDVFDLFRDLRSLEPDQFKQICLRDDEAVLSSLAERTLSHRRCIPRKCDHQAGDDSQGERNLDADSGASFLAIGDIDAAPDLLDVGFNYIHADAAAGDACDFCRR